MKGEALKGHLDMLLLAALTTGAAHGYAIITALRERSGGTFDLPEGTIYPALHRLEQSGLLWSSWNVVGGRRRRVYELTKRGRTVLAEQREAWWAFSGAVKAVLGSAT